MPKIAHLISLAASPDFEQHRETIKSEVAALCKKHPLY